MGVKSWELLESSRLLFILTVQKAKVLDSELRVFFCITLAVASLL